MLPIFNTKQIKPSHSPNEPSVIQISYGLLTPPYKIFSLVSAHFSLLDWMINLSLAKGKPSRSRISTLTSQGHGNFKESNINRKIAPVFSQRDCYNSILRIYHVSIILERSSKEDMQAVVISDAFKRMKHLRSVLISTDYRNFFTSDISPKFFNKVGKALKELRGIRKLTLHNFRVNFTENEVKVQTVYYALRSMRTLKQGKIKAPFNSPTLDNLFFLRKTFAKLQDLNLSFESKVVTLNYDHIPLIFSELKAAKRLKIKIGREHDLEKYILLGLEKLGGPDSKLEFLNISMVKSVEILKRFSNMKNLRILEISMLYTPLMNVPGDYLTLLELIPVLPNLTFFKLIEGKSVTKYEKNTLTLDLAVGPKMIQNLPLVLKKLSIVKNLIFIPKAQYNLREYGFPELIMALPDYTWLENVTFDLENLFKLEMTNHKDLTLKIAEFSEQDTVLTNALFEAIRTNTSLESLNLQIFNNPKPIEDKLEAISQALQTLKGLSTVKLNMKNSSKLTDKDLMIIAEGIEPLNLKIFTLRIDEASNKLTSKGVEPISRTLYKKKELRELVFTCNKCPKIEDFVIFGILSIGLPQWKSFEYAEIMCYNECEIKLKNPENLSLNFKSCSSLTVGGMEKLRETFNLLPNLKILWLLFENSPSAGDKAIQELFRNPENKSDLEEFRFAVTMNPKFGTLGVVSLNEFLSKISNEKLNCLNINIRKSGKIESDAFERLVLQIGNFSRLKIVSLDFSGIKSISNKELAIFGKILGEKLIGLERGGFYFEQCVSVTDVGVNALGLGVKLLEKIEELEILFDDNPKITGIGVRDLCEVCEKLMTLRMISLGFLKCGKLKPVDFQVLRELWDRVRSRRYGVDNEEKMMSEN